MNEAHHSHSWVERFNGLLVAVSEQGDIVFASRAFRDLPEMPSQPPQSAPLPAAQATILSVCRDAQAARRNVAFEMGEYSPAGISSWYEGTVELVADDEGRHTLAVAHCFDVTERKKTEELLRRSHALLVDAQGIAHLGTWEWDIAKSTVTWSSELYRIYGLTPAEYKPSYEGYLSKIHPDDRDRVHDVMMRVLSEHISFSHDERILWPDGSLRYLHTWGHPIMDDSGKLIGMLGVCQDITDRKLLEEELQAVERFRRIIFDTVSDVLFYLAVEPDEKFRFLAANEAFAKATGISLTRVTGHLVDEVIPEPSLGTVLEHYRRSIRERRPVRWDEITEYPAGTKYGEVTVTPLLNDDGACYALVGTVHDVTERVTAEIDTRRALATLNAIIEGTTDAVFLKNLAGQYQMINSAGARYLKRRPEEIIGKTDAEMLPPETAAEFTASDRKVILEGKTHTYEETGFIGGAMRTFLATKGPYHDEHGNVAGLIGISRDITEIKRTKDALANSLSILQATLESTADGILVLDLNERITGYNQRFLDLWRVPKGLIEQQGYREALRFVLSQLQHPDLCLKRLEEIFKAPLSESTDVLEFLDGKVFERYSRPQMVGDKVVGRVFSYRDITARVRAERALQENEARKTAILDSAVDSIITIDAQGLIVELNPAAEKMFGHKKADALGKEMAELIVPPLLRDAHRSGLRRYLATGEAHILGKRVEFSAVRADAVEFPVEVSITPIHAAGKPLFTGFIRDITDRKHNEERIRHQAARAKALADASSSFAEARLDVDALLTIVARRIAEYFHDGCIVRLRSEDKTQLHTVGFHHSDPDAHEILRRILSQPNAFVDKAAIRDMLATGTPVLTSLGKEQARARMRTEFGPIAHNFPIHSWMIVPLRVAGELTGSITIFRFRDAPPHTTEDLVFLQELADRAALAIDNGKLFAGAQKAIQLREDFISIASHELKTPLTPLKMQIDLLTRVLHSVKVDPGPGGELIPTIIATSGQQIARLTRLIDDMLDVSRVQSGRLTLNREEVELSELVSTVVERFQTQLDRAKCTVVMRAASHVHGTFDRMRIEQVVGNLLSNAVKYGAGMPIEIEVTSTPERAIIAIRDHGIGVSKEEQSKIFERFERAVSVSHFGGLGLGLYIARQIVEGHGGTISLESEPGQGARFSVELPLADDLRSSKIPDNA